jgi:hypothetical protein
VVFSNLQSDPLAGQFTANQTLQARIGGHRGQTGTLDYLPDDPALLKTRPFEMNTPRNGNAVFEWLLLFGLTAIAIVLTKLLGLRGRWSDAVIYTVVVFTVVIQMLRPAWDRPILWRSLSLIFALHVIGILIVVEVMPRSWRGIPGLLMTIVGVTEGLVVVALLWKKAGLRDRDGDKLHE